MTSVKSWSEYQPVISHIQDSDNIQTSSQSLLPDVFTSEYKTNVIPPRRIMYIFARVAQDEGASGETQARAIADMAGNRESRKDSVPR